MVLSELVYRSQIALTFGSSSAPASQSSSSSQLYFLLLSNIFLIEFADLHVLKLQKCFGKTFFHPDHIFCRETFLLTKGESCGGGDRWKCAEGFWSATVLERVDENCFERMLSRHFCEEVVRDLRDFGIGCEFVVFESLGK